MDRKYFSRPFLFPKKDLRVLFVIISLPKIAHIFIHYFREIIRQKFGVIRKRWAEVYKKIGRKYTILK